MTDVVVKLLNDDVNGASLYLCNGVIMIFVRRNDVDFIKNEYILQQCGCYILIGDKVMEKQHIYVGQTSNLSNRLQLHLRKKEFWSSSVSFVSNRLYNKSEVQYLEYLFIVQLIEYDNISIVENYQIPKEPFLSQEDKEIVTKDFDIMKLLLLMKNIDLFKYKTFDVDELRIKSDSKKLIDRVSRNYVLKYSDMEYDECSDEGIIKYIMSYNNSYVEAMVNKDGKIMILPFGFISTKQNPKIVSEKYNINIAANRKILSSITFDDLKEATEFVTGNPDDYRYWNQKIEFV